MFLFYVIFCILQNKHMHEWVPSSSPGLMWGGVLLKGTSAGLWRCPGTSPYYLNIFRLLLRYPWVPNPQILSGNCIELANHWGVHPTFEHVRDRCLHPPHDENQIFFFRKKTKKAWSGGSTTMDIISTQSFKCMGLDRLRNLLLIHSRSQSHETNKRYDKLSFAVTLGDRKKGNTLCMIPWHDYSC